MPILYYVQTSAFGLIITIIIFFHMIAHKGNKTTSRKIFWGLLLSNIILLILELLLNIFSGLDSFTARKILPVILCFFYIMNPVPEALWVLYLDSILRENKEKFNILLISLVAIPFTINLLLSVFSLSNGLLFYIDSANNYHRGPSFAIMFLLCYSYLLYNIMIIMIKRKYIMMSEFLVSLFAALLPVLAGVLQWMFFGVSLMWTALSFSLLIAYMNLQNEQTYRELRNLDKMKDEFLTNTSHELRTPLNGIINITGSLLENGNSNLNDVQLQNLQVVSSSARRLYSMINDILDISSLKKGEVSLKKQGIDLTSIVETMLYVFSLMKEDKEIEFVNSVPQDLPPVEADIERTYQIFYNLLGNALKFTPNGKIEVGAELLADYVEIWVADTGCGISKEQQSSIFNAFYMVDTTGTRETPGSGLGLAITWNLVKLHGGSIWVDSEPGFGSRFTFTLPISQSEEHHKTVTLPKPHIETSLPAFLQIDRERNKEQQSVLIADDDPASLTALFNILDQEGYHTKVVTNGQAALLELEKQNRYDLLILDIMMPRMSGYEVLQEIRQRFQPVDLPALLLTAKNRPEDLQAGFEAGANDYLSKPFEAQELRSRVKTLIQLKKSFEKRVETELSFLQAQIKPHFLFNSLSIIAALIKEHPQRAEALLYDLSDYLRGSFNFENYDGVTPLSSELATVRAYISLEKARFDGRLNVLLDIDENISVYVPMLVIQPLVENAIRHGTMKKNGGGTVKLSVKQQENNTVITIHDDGGGITERQLNEFLSGVGGGSGVGLKNIQRRMLLSYGHGLEISSSKDTGTTIVLKIPNHMR
ncbi:ATP-binding protein [Paenibacillus sp. DMB5]|uniref:ATP-binding protein n=1 Tax=Paenibacillus sp. DMB5 TaxID=1780103 RepID=UPI00076C5DA7|nr:ATP-binding protein [Paenibacillus sp. DMB5]KUP20884.1 hypothetical protein AWJ19_06355 [Paenibacillus sp. DMB5]